MPLFIPQEYQEAISVRGSVLLSGLVLIEIANAVFQASMVRVDFWAHMGGLFAGAVLAALYKDEMTARRQKEGESRSWVGKWFGE